MLMLYMMYIHVVCKPYISIKRIKITIEDIQTPVATHKPRRPYHCTRDRLSGNPRYTRYDTRVIRKKPKFV